MDKGNVQLFVVFTWLVQFATGASDWKELDGISPSVVKTHFVQLQESDEMETETNFPRNLQTSGEVNYINRPLGDSSDNADVLDKQDIEYQNKSTVKTTSSEESEEFSEEDTEKPLAVALLGSNVRFTISAEDERYTKRRHQLQDAGNDKENNTFSLSLPSATTKNNHNVRVQTATSKTATLLTEPVTGFSNTSSILYSVSTGVQNNSKIEANIARETNPPWVNPTITTQLPTTTSTETTKSIPKLTAIPLTYLTSTSPKSTTMPTTNAATLSTTPIPNSSTTIPLNITQRSIPPHLNTKNQSNTSPSTQPNSTSTTTTTTSTSTSQPNTITQSTTATPARATIRSRLVRPKMLQKPPRPTTLPTTKSPLTASSTIQLPSITETSISEFSATLSTSEETASTSMATPSETESIPVMTLLKDMTADYPLDVPPDIETLYDENDRKQSPSPTMSVSTTNTIVISSIIGGCAILFFALLMLFYMWKQRKVRRRRKRRIPQSSLAKPNNNWQFGQMYENG